MIQDLVSGPKKKKPGTNPNLGFVSRIKPLDKQISQSVTQNIKIFKYMMHKVGGGAKDVAQGRSLT